MTGFMAVPNRGQVLPFLDPKQLWRVIPSSCDRRGALTRRAPKPRSQKEAKDSCNEKPREKWGSRHQPMGTQLVRVCIIHRESQPGTNTVSV